MNQVVFITGGAQGIGFGIGQRFAAQGATVIVADVNGSLAQDAAAKLEQQGADGAFGVVCDVSQRESVERAVAHALERYERIDVLVNNAGICPFVPIMEMTPETWEKCLGVNLTGAFHCTQLIGRHMMERGEGGRIIAITSLAEEFTQPAQGEYGATKAGLKMLIAGFATALGPHGITCNCIAPGMILTPLTEGHWSQSGPAEHIKQLVPTGRIGQPGDIGDAAVFLASPQAAYINGVTLRVDGGFSILIKG